MPDTLTQVWTADPWSRPAVGPAAVPRRRSWLLPVLAGLVGASGVVLRLVQLGANARRAALVLVVAAVVWELVSHRASGRSWRWPALAAVAVVAEAVSAPSGGRAPALLLVASLVVADAVFVGWAPLRRWPPRHEQVASLAVFPLVAAQVVWFRNGSAVAMAVLLVLALVVVEGYHRAPAALGAADRGFRRAVLKLVDVLAGAVIFVCALPFLYLGGGLVRLGRAVRGRSRRAGTTWRGVATDPVADATVPFRSAPARVRRPRNAAAVLALLALVVGAVAVAQQRAGVDLAATTTTAPVPLPSAPPTTGPSTGQQLDLLEAVPYSERPAYAGVEWADTVQQDQAAVQLVPADGVGYRNSDARTRYVNVRNGLRVTPRTDCPGCPRRTVWLAGASTVFGIGQRDRGTVASELQRLAAEDGIDLRVVNLGVAGWTSDQTATDLEARLRATDRPPDAVVQLDGFNDVMAATGRVLQGRTSDPSPLRLDATGTLEALRRRGGFDDATTAQVTDLAARRYGESQDRIRAAASAAGAEYLGFFQPDAFASPRQLAQVRSLYRRVPGLLSQDSLGRVLRTTSEALSTRVVDLRAVYDGLDVPVLLDVVHTNELGARTVAEAVYPDLQPQLRR
jgi:lysophospholipase L1-like esterase